MFRVTIKNLSRIWKTFICGITITPFNTAVKGQLKVSELGSIMWPDRNLWTYLHHVTAVYFSCHHTNKTSALGSFCLNAGFWHHEVGSSVMMQHSYCNLPPNPLRKMQVLQTIADLSTLIHIIVLSCPTIYTICRNFSQKLRYKRFHFLFILKQLWQKKTHNIKSQHCTPCIIFSSR